MDEPLLSHGPPSGDGATVAVDVDARADHDVDPRLYGKFCEHLGRNVYKGMDAGVLVNPTFGHWPFSAGTHHPDGGAVPESDPDRVARQVHEYARRYDLPDPAALAAAHRAGCAFPWVPLVDGSVVEASRRGDVVAGPDAGPAGDRAQRLTPRTDAAVGVCQWTYLPLHRTRGFEFRVRARAAEPATAELAVRATGDGGAPGDPLATAPLDVADEWTTTEGTLRVPAGVADDAQVAVSVTTGAGVDLVLDRVLVYPDDHVNRADPEVVEHLREVDLPLLRWPGGNFVSGYRWRDGVGPPGERPTTENPAWGGVEPNRFGTHEFVQFCEAVGCEPMICVNAGDGTPEEAARWVEYCNGSTDTEMGALRADHGHPEPYDVTHWEVGNELFGTWQVGWTTPEGNADRYRRFREAMLDADPGIEVQACGNRNSPGDRWDDALLAAADGELTVTDHVLVGGTVDSGTDPDELLRGFLGYADQLGREYRDLRDRMAAAGVERPRLAVTELQLFADFEAEREIESHGGDLSPETTPTPRTVSEALYHATVVHECVRLGEFVAMLTHSATLNHGGGLRKQRERVWADPCHYGHGMGAALAGGTPVAVDLACDTISTDNSFGDVEALDGVPELDAMAVLADGDLVTMLVNRTPGEAVPVDLTAPGASLGETAEVTTLAAEEMSARNTFEDPERVTPETATADVDDGVALTLPPYSLTRVTVPLR